MKDKNNYFKVSHVIDFLLRRVIYNATKRDKEAP
jgi:hypothetical protein